MRCVAIAERPDDFVNQGDFVNIRGSCGLCESVDAAHAVDRNLFHEKFIDRDRGGIRRGDDGRVGVALVGGGLLVLHGASVQNQPRAIEVDPTASRVGPNRSGSSGLDRVRRARSVMTAIRRGRR